MRAGKGISGRGHGSCKGPEVRKNTQNAGDPKRIDVAAEMGGRTCTEGAGKVGRGQILWGPAGAREGFCLYPKGSVTSQGFFGERWG